MAPGADPAFQTAMDKLMLQVNQENILAAHHAFQKHADDLRGYLRQVDLSMQFGLCGGDPVSRDAASEHSFVGKIRELLNVHWKHWEELEAVAAHLRDVALEYGHTEDQIARSMADR